MFYDLIILYFVIYLLYNVRENNLRIRRLKKEVRILKTFRQSVPNSQK